MNFVSNSTIFLNYDYFFKRNETYSQIETLNNANVLFVNNIGEYIYMKTKIIPTIIAAALGFAATQASFAADGTIDFVGEITANTCTVQIDNSSTGSGTVTLPTISASALPTPSSVAGTTAFNIELSNCSIATDTTVSTYFEPGAYTTTTGRLAQSNGAGAQNVEIQLLNSAQDVIDTFGAAGNQNDTGVAMNTGEISAVLTYYAQYYATGLVTPGAVTSQVSYSIIYD